mmetsp:Transcript_29104/g.72935  ORF Transcript_29104/g.72935 Transcript_29104/m.72935 type:complete len:214 (+) Transcript_29104:78-719(+)
MQSPPGGVLYGNVKALARQPVLHRRGVRRVQVGVGTQELAALDARIGGQLLHVTTLGFDLLEGLLRQSTLRLPRGVLVGVAPIPQVAHAEQAFRDRRCVKHTEQLGRHRKVHPQVLQHVHLCFQPLLQVLCGDSLLLGQLDEQVHQPHLLLLLDAVEHHREANFHQLRHKLRRVQLLDAQVDLADVEDASVLLKHALGLVCHLLGGQLHRGRA